MALCCLLKNNFNFNYLDDSGVWTFSVGSGRNIPKQSKIAVDIFESGANARFYASKESTEGCPIPQGRYTTRDILGGLTSSYHHVT